MLDWIYVVAVFGAFGCALWLQTRRAWVIAAVIALLGAAYFRHDLAMQKMASILALPSSLFWVLLGALALRLAAERRRGLALWAAGLFASYTLLGNVWVAGLLLGALERDVPRVDLASMPELDALLVLGGGAGFDAAGEAQLTDFGDRVMLAARIHHAGKAHLLVTSGSSIPGLHRPSDLSEATFQLWTGIGIPDDSILKLPDPKNTSQEIAAFAELVRARRLERVGVLTSAWHLRRALALCRVAGLDVVPIGADRRSGQPGFHPAFLVPSPGGFRITQLALWEVGGALLGR